MTNTNPLWDDNLIQFARLIVELGETSQINWAALQEAMDLDLGEIDDLFDRAHDVWERAKSELLQEEDL